MRGSWRADAVLAHRLELPGGAVTAATARRWVAAQLAQHVSPADLLDIEVLVSELVTNAVRHGHAGEDESIVVHLAIGAGVLRVEVCDQGPGFTPPAALRPRPEGGGHGLLLVERLSSAWGVASDDGTCVWFERVLAPR
jgi:anti-sigma regulatory factor (Ser/Thr protein kinase)